MIWNFVLVFLLGVVITLVVVARIASGTLKVFIPDDPNEPACLGVQLGRALRFIHKKKYVLFKVEVESLKSQN